MPLHRIQVSIQFSEEANFISDFLFELGALSVSVEDGFRGTDYETPIFDEPPLLGTLAAKPIPILWKNAKISALYPIQCDIEQLTMLIATEFNLVESPIFSLESDLFDEKDPDTWIREVQASFVPIVVGRIRISFPWHDVDPSFTNIKLEPGCAFGTGEHPTTKLCLGWLQRTIKPNMTLLDFGTGSGILAIAAVLFGEGIHAVGVDLDVNAVSTAISNAKRNHVLDDVVFCESCDEPQGKKYDVIVANILAEPLKWLAAKLVCQLKPGGYIGLAGVLCSQAVDVMQSYQREGIVLEQAEVDNNWALLIGRKPASQPKHE
ncbi:Ribosomal protein L11 methyltransferase (PrmA) [Gracilaria domingensis]|nr:Ribosomal protein L11 methyltransferase (PrmA) [Gracilaria domingensis]